MIKISLNTQILLGGLLGILVGISLNIFGQEWTCLPQIIYICTIVGGVFIGLLKMILIPLVFTSLVVGITQLTGNSKNTLIWKMSLAYFIGTSALAVLLGLIVVNIIKPGVGVNIEIFKGYTEAMALQTMALPDFIQSFVLNLFINPIQAMAKGQVLPVLLFAILFGLACVSLGEKAKTIKTTLREVFNIVMKLVHWIMYLSPYGITALLIKMLAKQDLTILSQLGSFIGVVIFCILFHGFVQLPIIMMIFTKRNPLAFFHGIKNAMITAFSTSSSIATLPVTMECVEDNLGVKKDVSAFVLPLGATINMDGTALYEAVAALFIANISGIELSILHQLIVFFIAIAAAVGAPGIPNAGMVTMVMVLESVGLPTEAIAILLPIDRLLDSFRTAINVEGDAIGACIIHKRLQKT
jgi:Na+/H+-dicarboxylate symporter